MLLEIITVVLALHGAEEIDHVTTTPYNFRQYDYSNYDSQESIYDNSEDPITTKTTETKQTIKTLSPEEIEEVKRAIHQMLPGYEENSFTKLREVRGAHPTPLPYNPDYQDHKSHTRYSNKSGNVFSKSLKSFTRSRNAHPYYPFYEMYTPQEIWEVVSFEPGKADSIQHVASYHTPISTATTVTETTTDNESTSEQLSDGTEEHVVVEKRQADDVDPVPSTEEPADSTEEADKGDEKEPNQPTATEPGDDGEEPEKGEDVPENPATPEPVDDAKESGKDDEEKSERPTAAKPMDMAGPTKGNTKETVKPLTVETGEDEEEPDKSDAEESVLHTTEPEIIESGIGDAGEPAPGAKPSGVETKEMVEKELSANSSITNAMTAKGLQSKTSGKVTTTKRTLRRTTTKFQLDVPMLLQIIANLTYDYEMNLTDNLNETLIKLSIPTCGTPTTTVKTGPFIDYEANATGSIVAKCFVCGLEEEKVPHHAQCADAFAGDFLPLVPVDMTARGRISKYRKYCRYLDVPHYLVNSSMPRSVYGRWTGGCSVRWIDLSGIYTQRTCRNRERAIMGRHVASKRMAKLEMALNNMDDGCISSPMATLVPLSRGISLYARFHACVCTGSWCNAAADHHRWLLVPLLGLYSLSTRLANHA